MSLSVGVTSLFFSLTNIKENNMAIDFRRNQSCSPPPTYINGNCIEMVDQHKYLGTMIDNKLKFDVNTDTICKKGQQRWYLLRTLNSFNVDKVMLSLFYTSLIESVLTFSCIA